MNPTAHRPPGYPPHSRPVPGDPAVDALVAALPEVRLHCHRVGTVAPRTGTDLAAEHGVPLERGVEDLHDHDSYEDLGEFLPVLDVVGSVIRDADDPPMSGTDPTHDLRVLAHALGNRRGRLAPFITDAIDACWLDEPERSSLRRRAARMVAATPDAPAPTSAASDPSGGTSR